MGAVLLPAPIAGHLAVDHQHGDDDHHLPARALLQNSQERSDEALQQKLNAVADGLADLMRISAGDHPEVLQDRQELLRAVGLENRESA